LISSGDVDEVARHQQIPAERLFIAGKSFLVLSTAFDEIERDPREPALRQPAQVLDVDCCFQAWTHTIHSLGATIWRSTLRDRATASAQLPGNW
jgi:hypothetical protein